MSRRSDTSSPNLTCRTKLTRSGRSTQSNTETLDSSTRRSYAECVSTSDGAPWYQPFLTPRLSFLNKPLSAYVLVDWADNARDILSFFLNYLPDGVSSEPLPTHLERVPSAVADQRRASGFNQRSLVCVGHSYGGCSLWVSYTLIG